MTQKLTTTLAGALLLTLAAGPTAPAAAQEDADAMKDAVKSLRDEYFATYEAKQPEKAASLFTSDGVLLAPATAALRGPEQIRQRLQAFLQDQAVSLGALSEETLVSGERVLDRGIVTLEVTPAGSDQTSTDTGKYVLVAEKEQPEGGGEATWRIAWLIWNTDHPMRSAPSGGEDEEG
jgi:uncharacterized protein (TIGR02246 family)